MGQLYRVDEIHAIKVSDKKIASSLLEVDEWPAFGQSASFHFVYKYGRAVWADPPLDANIICLLPKALFNEQTHLQDALNKLLRGIKDYQELLDGQLVETKLDYPGKTIIQHLPPTLGSEYQKHEQQERRKNTAFSQASIIFSLATKMPS